MSNARTAFVEAYRLARTNRRNELWQGQMFRFPSGSIFLALSGNIIVAGNNFINECPGYRAGMLNVYKAINLRFMAVNASRACGRVPLP